MTDITDVRPSIAELHLQFRDERPMGVLLEIAAAALALRDAHAELDVLERNMLHVGRVSFDQLVGGRHTHDARVRINECGAALLEALAKVRP
jgi:hypothetical protein